MPEFTPVDALMKGAQEPERYYNYKCNNPDEDGESGGSLQGQTVYLRKHHNRGNLNAATDSWYLYNAAKRDESKEYYYICNFKFGSDRKGAEQRVVATENDGPLDGGVKQQERQGPGGPSGFHALGERREHLIRALIMLLRQERKAAEEPSPDGSREIAK